MFIDGHFTTTIIVVNRCGIHEYANNCCIFIFQIFQGMSQFQILAIAHSSIFQKSMQETVSVFNDVFLINSYFEA